VSKVHVYVLKDTLEIIAKLYNVSTIAMTKVNAEKDNVFVEELIMAKLVKNSFVKMIAVVMDYVIIKLEGVYVILGSKD